MKGYINVLHIAIFIICIFCLSRPEFAYQFEKRKLSSFADTEKVYCEYPIKKQEFFHSSIACPKLIGDSFELTFQSVLERDYPPCPYCFDIDIDINAIREKIIEAEKRKLLRIHLSEVSPRQVFYWVRDTNNYHAKHCLLLKGDFIALPYYSVVEKELIPCAECIDVNISTEPICKEMEYKIGRPLTPSEISYLKKAGNYPDIFSCTKNECDKVWARIQSFIAKYSSMKIQINTEFTVETYNPIEWGNIGYKAIKIPLEDSFEFEVSSYARGPLIVEVDKLKTSLFAYYAKTGEIMPIFIMISY